MLPLISLPNGRCTTALAFGCASLLRLSDAADRQRLLDQAVDHGIRHFDVARLYGLGQAEAELGALVKRNPGQLTVATKFGLGDSRPPSAVSQRQGLVRDLLRKVPLVRPVTKRLYGGALIKRDFSVCNCRRSLTTSLHQLGLDSVDFLLLHEPRSNDPQDSGLEDLLVELLQQGLIGGYGLSGHLQELLALIRHSPGLACHLVQWEDSGLASHPDELLSLPIPNPLLGRFGRIRCSIPVIQHAFLVVPQLQKFWSDRLAGDLSDTDFLVAALLTASLAAHPFDLLLFSTSSPDRLQRTMKYIHEPPWSSSDLLAFDKFWRQPSASSPVALSWR